MDRRLEDLAVETLSRALVAPSGLERMRPMERAIELHQRACEADERGGPVSGRDARLPH
jgi:hypothetical protein